LESASLPCGIIAAMDEPVIAWRWWIVDEVTGKRRLTKGHMT